MFTCCAASLACTDARGRCALCFISRQKLKADISEADQEDLVFKLKVAAVPVDDFSDKSAVRINPHACFAGLATATAAGLATATRRCVAVSAQREPVRQYDVCTVALRIAPLREGTCEFCREL
jgi:hypothetical protein